MRTPPDGRLLDELARFEARVRELALAIVNAVVRQELQSRLDELRLDAPKSSRRNRTTRKQPAALEVPQTPGPIAPPNPVMPAQRGRKPRWTRDAIVNELVGWLVSGTTIDASFVTRYGPHGLVSATRKMFGRFDAALNVAALEVAKRYPDGPPTRRAS